MATPRVQLLKLPPIQQTVGAFPFLPPYPLYRARPLQFTRHEAREILQETFTNIEVRPYPNHHALPLLTYGSLRGKGLGFRR